MKEIAYANSNNEKNTKKAEESKDASEEKKEELSVDQKLKEAENKSYTDIEKIKKEVLDAKNTFKKYQWPMIDVTRKSVEETAASVIKIYEIYKQND